MNEKIKRVLVPSALAALTFLFIYAGWLGLDFGIHWDEPRTLNSVSESLRTGHFLPGWYNYPSLGYLISLLASQLEFLDVFIPGEFSGVPLIFRARLLFICFAAGSGLLIYFLGREAGLGKMTALISAGLLLFSWEFGYHARWVAPDHLMVFFVLLSMLVLLKWQRQQKLLWLIAAATAAGVAIGAKYNAIFILIPFAITLWIHRTAFKKIWLLLPLILIFSFILTTPGSILETGKFISDIRFEQEHYSEGHSSHTVKQPADHFSGIASWFLFHVYSPFAPVSFILALASLAGAWMLYIKDRKLFLILLTFPVLYNLFFIFQKAMIVRNYLVLLPFGVLCIGYLLHRMRDLKFRAVPKLQMGSFLPVIAGCMVLANAGFSVYAGKSIERKKNPRVYVRQVKDWVEEHQGEKLLATAAVRQVYQNLLGEELALPMGRGGPGTKIIMIHKEFKKYFRLVEANHWDYYDAVFAPLDVNLNYYPSWPNEKIVVMDWEYAKKFPLRF